MIVANKDFKRVNGLSNQYWGWGLEDEEFREQLHVFGVGIIRPDRNLVTTGHNDTFLDTHTGRRVRDDKLCHTENKPYTHRHQNDGVNTTKYNITDVRELTISGAKLTILNVDFPCDRNVTPWCDCSDVL